MGNAILSNMSNHACPPDIAERAEFFPSRSAWLDARKSGLGGSDVAAALGLSPWKSRYALWAEKTGEVDPTFEGNLNTRCGTLLEPVVRTLWQEDRPEARIFHHPAWLVRHPTLPFLYSSLDWTFDEDGVLGIGEAKAPVATQQIEKWKDGGVPVEYQLQGQHALLCTGRSVVSFARLMPGHHGWDFDTIDVERHEGCQAMLVEKLTEFWNLVVTRTPPEVDGHESTRKALRMHRRMGVEEADPKAWITMPDGSAQLHANLIKAKADKKDAEGRIDLIENMLVQMMSGHRYGVIPGVGRYSNSCSKMPERTQIVKAHERWSFTFSEKVNAVPDFGAEGAEK